MEDDIRRCLFLQTPIMITGNYLDLGNSGDVERIERLLRDGVVACLPCLLLHTTSAQARGKMLISVNPEHFKHGIFQQDGTCFDVLIRFSSGGT